MNDFPSYLKLCLDSTSMSLPALSFNRLMYADDTVIFFHCP